MGMTVAILLGIPLFHVARVDLWGGSHWLLGRPVHLGRGIAGVGGAIASFYAMTLFLNIFGGRLFCGFGCPVGQLSRFSDVVDAFAPGTPQRRRAWLQLIGFASLLATSVVLWWVAPGVFLSGEWQPTAIATAAIAAVAGAATVHGRYFRWDFCRKACPIGLYYSVVQTGALVQIDFDSKAACFDCGACSGICPAHLDPRHLDQTIPSPGGLGFAGLPGDSHCLRCGQCVDICEQMMRKRPGPAAMGFRRPKGESHEAHDGSFGPSEPQPT